MCIAISGQDSFGYKEIEVQMKLASKNQLGKELGTNAITTLITDCKNHGWLLQEKDRAPYTIGSFNQSEI